MSYLDNLTSNIELVVHRLQSANIISVNDIKHLVACQFRTSFEEREFDRKEKKFDDNYDEFFEIFANSGYYRLPLSIKDKLKSNTELCLEMLTYASKSAKYFGVEDISGNKGFNIDLVIDQFVYFFLIEEGRTIIDLPFVKA